MKERTENGKTGKRKKIALKGMIVFLCVVAGCMFFSRTFRNLTTPKVHFNAPSQGRLSKTENLQGTLYYPDAEEVYYEEAREYPMTITRVMAKANTAVKEGDPILKAEVTDGASKMDTLRKEYRKTNAELAALDAANQKYPTTTERSERLTRYLDAMDALSAARIGAANKGLDESAWAAEQKAAEKAKQDFEATWIYSSMMVSDEVYQYVTKRQELLTQLEESESKMAALQKAMDRSGEVTAPADGFIVSMELKAGDPYDGLAPLYKTAKTVYLRAETENRYEPGNKGKIPMDWSSIETKVAASGVGKDGKRTVDFEISDDLLSASGGLAGLADSETKIVITRKSTATGTLIPASCLRDDNNGKYVFVAEYTSQGLLDSGYKLIRFPVTELDKNDSQVLVSEDLYGMNIVDRENRTISEGMTVMEE